MKLLIELNFLHASMAADPVSPDVAPKTIAVLFCFINDLLKNAAANCKPKSLKAAVGPWNNSKISIDLSIGDILIKSSTSKSCQVSFNMSFTSSSLNDDLVNNGTIYFATSIKDSCFLVIEL